MKTLLIRCSLVSVLALSGCLSADSAPDSDGEQSEEDPTPEVGQVRHALGEAACATFSLTSGGTTNGITRAFNVSTANKQVSTDWTYQPGAGSCPWQYIVEYTGLPAADPDYRLQGNSGAIRPEGTHALSGISNEIDCERTRVYTGVYVWDTNTTNPTVTYTLNGRGLWVPPPNILAGCNLDIQSKSPSSGVWEGGTTCQGCFTVPTGKYKIRVATRVDYCANTGCDSALHTDLFVQTELSRIPSPD